MSSDIIPLMRPDIGPAELEAVTRVLQSGWLVQGKEVERFEQSIASRHDLLHGIAVSSATAGLHLAYEALGIQKNEVILIPSFAWPSAANMAVRCGAEVVFVDVEPLTYNICPKDLKTKLSQCKEAGKRVQGLVVVHEFGLPADMDAIMPLAETEHIWVIEDAACALGARLPSGAVGTFGVMGVFSFHPRKSLTTGEGGCIVTNDPDLEACLRSLRNHGQIIENGQRQFGSCGWNYRLTEFQGALGNTQLERYETMLAQRRQVAAWYHQHLSEIEGLALPPLDESHTWQTFMTVLGDAFQRDNIVADMRKQGIECSMGAFAAHRLNPFASRHLNKEDDCPVSTQLLNQGLALPLHAFLDETKVKRVAESLKVSLSR
jgi:dTDP-4-amino-4,6-dideoxygalactose transaminase